MDEDDDREEVRVVTLSSFPQSPLARAGSSSPPPSDSSPFLQSLVAIASAPPKSYLIEDPDTSGSLLELSHYSSTVQLSSPTAVVRQYTFPQAVLAALPARLPCSAHAAFAKEPQASTSTLFSPFRTAPPPAWTDSPLPLPVAPTPPISTLGQPLQPHTVVLLQTYGVAYPPVGPPVTFALKRPIRQAWPLEHGILLKIRAGLGWLWDPRATFSKVEGLEGCVVYASTQEPRLILTTTEDDTVLNLWQYEMVDALAEESNDAKSLQMQRLWAGKVGLTKGCATPTKGNVVLFDVRPNCATLAVLLGSESQLVFLKVSVDESAGSTAVHITTPASPKELEASSFRSLASVLCTRVHQAISDLLLLTITGELVVLPTVTSSSTNLGGDPRLRVRTAIESSLPPTSSFLTSSTNCSTRQLSTMIPPATWSDLPLWTAVSRAVAPGSFALARRHGVLSLFQTSASDVVTAEEQEALLQSLHLWAEEGRMMASREGRHRGELVLQCSHALGLRGWVDYYYRLGFGGKGKLRAIEVGRTSASPTFPATPPSLADYLQSILVSLAASPSRFPPSPFAFSMPSSKPYDDAFLPNPPDTLSHLLSTIYESRTASVIHDMGFTKASVEDLNWGVRAPLREVLRAAMSRVGSKTDDDWESVEVLDLIGRKDLTLLQSLKKKTGSPKQHERPDLSIDKLCAFAKDGKMPAAQPRIGEVEKAEQVPTRFAEDRRLEEVQRMLQYTQPVIVSAGDRTLDQLTPQVQQNILSSLANRTFSLPVGYGMFRLHSSTSTAIPSSPPPKVNTTARILPMPSAVALVDREPRDGSSASSASERAEWPDFHAGVAAALQLPSGQGEFFDPTQLAFSKPSEPDSRHAGFLMGLGLNGRLSALGFNQAFEYLKPKHDPTSIGLLLGLGVAYLGTGDPKVTSLLAVHLAPLHPQGSSSLNVSGITQAAAMVGVGLIYLGSGKRLLADIMVKELCSITVTSIEDPQACREAYALSAGFAFGLIMLGKGSASPHGEVKLLRTFRALILGERTHPLPGLAPSSQTPDVQVTSPAATVALALMYLRSEREDVAAILDVPDTLRRLDYVRADLLLLRTLARCLIMWDSVGSSKPWVESKIPAFIVEALPPVGASSAGKTVDPDLDIARWNIIAGACFGMGLKFAGTAAAEAHATLIHYLDRLTRAAFSKAPTVHSKVKRTAIRSCWGVVAGALAMVMAGTGEINALRRLRVAHGHFSEGVTYSTHLASHMALGLLFVGDGQYTLGTSDSAIASLLLAFYPAYPPTSSENRAHLQAYRHLWTLAVEPRCLKVRDVDTGASTFLPVKLRLIDHSNVPKSKALVAPTLIPEIKLIASIQVDSPRYWPFTVNLSGNDQHRAAFLRDATIYVKRRTGHLSYAQDPRGVRSIFTRSKSETGSSVFDFGETAKMLAPSATGLRDFVASFANDAEAIAAVAELCHPAKSHLAPTAFEAFSASVLLECLTRDKREAISLYQAMFYANALLHENNVTFEALVELEQLEFIISFYSRSWKSHFGRSRTKSQSSPTSSKPEPLIQPALIAHASRKIEERGEKLVVNPLVATALEAYLTTSVWPTTSTVSRALAAYLRTQNAPDLITMEHLRGLTRSAAQDVDEVRIEAITLIVHEVGKTMEQAGGGAAWNQSWTRLAVRAWLR